MISAVPFRLKRSSDLWDSSGGYTTTTETAHGLVRLEEERLVIQWRREVRTESMAGKSGLYATEEEIEPVKETIIPLHHVAGAMVARPWWRILTGPRLVIAAANLLAFEKIAGAQGLKLKHPAKLELRIKRADCLIAEEFAAEMALTVARLPTTGQGAAKAIESGSD